MATSSITSPNITGSIIIAGSAIKNQILTAIVTDIDGTSGTITYQWQSSSNGTNWTDIVGATSSTLVLTASLVGKRVRVSASYTDDFGTSENLISTATASITSTNIEGLVVVAGSPTRGQVLTAVVTDIDGTSGTIAYQWQSSSNGSNWSNVSGATSSTLLLTNSLVGRQIRVTISYTDDFGFTESLTSLATSFIAGINTVGTIVIAGNPVREQTLTVIVFDPNGINGKINYQWQSSLDNTNWVNITEATSSTLLLTNLLVGKRIRATASYTDSFGANESLISTATEVITGNNTVGTIVLAGSAVRGQVLTVIINDFNGISGTPSYQWESTLDNLNWINIPGATSSILLLNAFLVGKRIRAKASYTDNFGISEFLTSATTDVITDIDSVGKVIITGNLVKGESLTATVTDENNISGEINYQWMAKSAQGNWNSITSENTSTLLLTRALVGKNIRVLADYIDGLGNSEYVVSAETESVANINTTGIVNIVGFPIAGGTLRAIATDEDGLIDIPINYQWQSTIDLQTWEDILEATNQTIFLVPELIGKQLRVFVEYTDELATSESIFSAPTDQVIPSTEDGTLTIGGEPRQHKVLTAIIQDLNGVNELTVTYQWQNSLDNIEWANIPGATNKELYLKAAYQNQFIRVASTYQTLLGNLIELTSDRTRLIKSPFSSLDFVDSINPYRQSSFVNAVFTLESFPDWIVDVETGNLVPDSNGNKVIVCTATIKQKKDPNLVVQPGVDYNRIYFEGYLINPKTLPNLEQGRNVTAVINGKQGIFDFIPIMESGQEMTLKQREINGQRIAGYFRLGISV